MSKPTFTAPTLIDDEHAIAVLNLGRCVHTLLTVQKNNGNQVFLQGITRALIEENEIAQEKQEDPIIAKCVADTLAAKTQEQRDPLRKEIIDDPNHRFRQIIDAADHKAEGALKRR